MQTKSFIVSTVLLVCVISFTANAADWYPFPDTGQTNCYDVDGDVIDCPAEGEVLHGQDAQYTDVAQSFQDNGDNTITDLNTTLMWQNTDDGSYTWEKAMHYCLVLTLAGYDDWRLPEIIELQSIADYSGVVPAINPLFSVPDDEAGYGGYGGYGYYYPSYWSATTNTNNPDPVWTIDFDDGHITTSGKDNTYNIRCVRAGRPSESFDLTVIVPESGSGEVHFTPPDEPCTTSCSKNYITGTEVTLTATAATGSGFSGWTGDGCSGTGNCVVTMDQVRDVTATFTFDSYTLTYAAGDNGSIDGTSPQTVSHGSDGSSVLAVPGEGYAFDQWSDGSTDNPRIDTNVTADMNVTASFEIIYYSLTYAAGANGSIDGTSPQTVSHGSDGASVLAVPGEGYTFDEWSDGSTDNPRTDTNVTADVSVTASFELIYYTLTYTAVANGSISGTSPQIVSYGSDGSSVFALPGEGYEFVLWSDGFNDDLRIDTNVTADISVTANFQLIPYTLTYTAGTGGSISGTSPQTVGHGNDGSSVLAVPGTGYAFVQWSDGSTDNPRTDSRVTADINVTAIFEIDTYTLTYNTDGECGFINGTSPQTVNHGGDGFSVEAEAYTVSCPNHVFVRWSDGSTENPRIDTNVRADIDVNAIFELPEYTLIYRAGNCGIILGEREQTVQHGSYGSPVRAVVEDTESCSFFEFVRWSDDYAIDVRTDSNVTADLEVTAIFIIEDYISRYGPSETTISSTDSAYKR